MLLGFPLFILQVYTQVVFLDTVYVGIYDGASLICRRFNILLLLWVVFDFLLMAKYMTLDEALICWRTIDLTV